MWTSVSADVWPRAPGGGCGMGKVPIFTLWTALPKPARADTAFLHLFFFLRLSSFQSSLPGSHSSSLKQIRVIPQEKPLSILALGS